MTLDAVMGIPRMRRGFSRDPPVGFAAEFALGGVAERQQVTERHTL